MGNPEYLKLLEDVLQTCRLRETPKEIRVDPPATVITGFKSCVWEVLLTKDDFESRKKSWKDGQFLSFLINEPATDDIRWSIRSIELFALWIESDGSLWINVPRISQNDPRVFVHTGYSEKGDLEKSGSFSFAYGDIFKTLKQMPELLEMLAKPLPQKIDFNATFERLVAALESGEFVNPNDLLVPVTGDAQP